MRRAIRRRHPKLFQMPRNQVPQSPMRQLHSLRPSRRPRRVDHVSELLRQHSHLEITALICAPLFIFHEQYRYTQIAQRLAQRTLREEYPHACIAQHVTTSFQRIIRIERQVRSTGFQYRKLADYHGG